MWQIETQRKEPEFISLPISHENTPTKISEYECIPISRIRKVTYSYGYITVYTLTDGETYKIVNDKAISKIVKQLGLDFSQP